MRRWVGGLGLIGGVLVALACGGAGGKDLTDVTDSTWDCASSSIAFVGSGLCFSDDLTWGCGYTQTGRDVVITWTPGPSTPRGNEEHTWEGQVGESGLDFTGKIKMTDWSGDFACLRRPAPTGRERAGRSGPRRARSSRSSQRRARGSRPRRGAFRGRQATACGRRP